MTAKITIAFYATIEGAFTPATQTEDFVLQSYAEIESAINQMVDQITSVFTDVNIISYNIVIAA